MATRSMTVTTSDGHGNETTRTVTYETTVEQDNDETIRQQAANALVNNRTYVALTSPTAAQTTAQVKALSRQNNGLIRQLLGLLDGTD
jgi:hypothetical protein